MVPSPKMRGRPVKTITGLVKPWGIAVCDNGDIVVAESGSDRVTIVNKEGKKVRSFGTRGTKEGHFTNFSGVAISTDGHILAVDHHRLQKLTFDGVCIKSVGSNQAGSGQLQFSFPEKIYSSSYNRTDICCLQYITRFGSHGTTPVNSIDRLL